MTVRTLAITLVVIVGLRFTWRGIVAASKRWRWFDRAAGKIFGPPINWLARLISRSSKKVKR